MRSVSVASDGSMMVAANNKASDENNKMMNDTGLTCKKKGQCLCMAYDKYFL